MIGNDSGGRALQILGNGAASGGGGGAAFTIMIFADAAARDAFYNMAANRSTLAQGMTRIHLEDGGAMVPVEQVWGGATNPGTYDNTEWITLGGAAALTAAEIKTLYESNADTNALIDSKLQILNYLSIGTNPDRVISSRSWEFPPGSALIGPLTTLGAALRALHVRSGATGNTALLLAQLYDDTTGFSRPFAYSGTPDTVVLNDPAGTDTTDVAEFPRTLSADEILYHVMAPTNRPSETLPFSVTIRLTDSSGPIVAMFEGMITTNAQGDAELDLRNDLNPILGDSGMVLHFRIECQGLQGVDMGGGVFVPNLTVRRIVVTRQELMTQVTGSAFANPSIHSLSSTIDGRHDIGDTLNGAQTFNFTIEHEQSVQGDLTLTVDGSDYTITTPTSDGPVLASVTLSGISTAAARTFTYRISGTDVNGAAFQSAERTVTIAAHGTAYWLASASATLSGILSTDMNSVEVDQSGERFRIPPDGLVNIPDGHRLYLLMPTTHDAGHIYDLAFSGEHDARSQFTRTVGASTQDSVTGILYLLQNNAGVAVQMRFEVEVA